MMFNTVWELYHNIGDRISNEVGIALGMSYIGDYYPEKKSKKAKSIARDDYNKSQEFSFGPDNIYVEAKSKNRLGVYMNFYVEGDSITDIVMDFFREYQKIEKIVKKEFEKEGLVVKSYDSGLSSDSAGMSYREEYQFEIAVVCTI